MKTKIANFKIPVALSIPIDRIEEIRNSINLAITGVEDINIRDEDGRLVLDPKLNEHEMRLRQAHWNLNASHSSCVEVTVYSDGTMEITK